jgi:hypothetical protein
MMSDEQRKITTLQFLQLLAKPWGRSANNVNEVSMLKQLEFIGFTPQLSRNVYSPCFKDALTMKPDNFFRKQDSLRSVQVKSAPSTSDEHAGQESLELGACEVNANVNTPCKILLKILPITEYPRGRIRSGSSQLLY